MAAKNREMPFSSGQSEKPGTTAALQERNAEKSVQLAMAKMVDDMLLAGPWEALDEFNSDLTKRF